MPSYHSPIGRLPCLPPSQTLTKIYKKKFSTQLSNFSLHRSCSWWGVLCACVCAFYLSPKSSCKFFCLEILEVEKPGLLVPVRGRGDGSKGKGVGREGAGWEREAGRQETGGAERSEAPKE